MHPLKVPGYITKHLRPTATHLAAIHEISAAIKKLTTGNPLVSIIIPAFNEAHNILNTISSLSSTSSGRPLEIIVVNNNSSDETANLSEAAGVTCLNESVQGITAARNRGLQHARGQFILNADADTIYPPRWIDLMLEPLLQESTALVYGNHAFLPTDSASRPAYFFYEQAAHLSRWINRKFTEEAVNVYGFNSAFRRLEAVMVDAFNHPVGTNEDGWLAVKLRDRLHKKLFLQSNPEATVWTSNRRIISDGGLLRASLKRLTRR